MAYGTPLSSGDLTIIAKSLAEWERLLTTGGEYRPRAALISRIEVTRPDDTEVIGHFEFIDGWLGFQPLNSKEN